ncbi:MAG TPA: lipid A biosynthesis acyltransferase [Sulfurospirillum sp. UBA11407]|nr:MAG TPA: lipid A biosynthesis acyltransferase [Sulfurospirillum sp. UBA11407]
MYLIIFKTFSFLIQNLPNKFIKSILNLLAQTAFLVDKKHRKIAQVNLDLAYEDTLSQKEKEQITKKCYQNLLYLLRDFIQNQDISKEALLNKVTIHNEHFYKQAKAYDKGIIFLTAHYGNWELLSLTIGAIFGNLTVIGRKLDSEKMNAILEKNRNQFNITLLEKKGALKGMLKTLKEKKNIGLLVDQNTSEGEGLLINFFGKLARHTPSAALISRKMEAPILPVFITTNNYEHFDITFHEPFFTAKTENTEKDILESVQKQATITQKIIEAKPDEWFWFHRRWKNQYARIYES